jgi:hypothetical protein
MTTNPFTLLKESVNPLVQQVLEDEDIFADPLLQLFDKDDMIGENGNGIQTPESGEIEIYQFRSKPAVIIGDKWAYEAGTHTMIQGKIKAKKMTIEVRISEDEVDRWMKSVSGGGRPTLIERGVKDEMKTSIAYLRQTLVQFIFDPWAGVTTSEHYDSSFRGFFATSSTGTLTSPSDLNSTAGTAEDISTTVKLSGSNQTAFNVDAILNKALTNFTKEDYLTKLLLPVGQIYMGVTPKVMAILKSKRDMYNTTTFQSSTNFYYQDFINVGIIPIVHTHFDPNASVAEDGTTTLVLFADPQSDFTLYNIPPPEGEAWSEWDKETNVKDGIKTYSYERHKKLEFACQARGYWFNISATAGSVFKKVCHIKVTTFDDAD